MKNAAAEAARKKAAEETRAAFDRFAARALGKQSVSPLPTVESDPTWRQEREHRGTPAAQRAQLAARVLQGERELLAIKPVWREDEPDYALWLSIVERYEALCMECPEG